jgi:prefoldin subunit 4
LILTSYQLSREEEEAMGEEKEVRKEDQDRINRFSRLHSREKLVEDDLKTKQASSGHVFEAIVATNTRAER